MVDFRVQEKVDTKLTTNSYIPTGLLIMKASSAAALTNYDTDAKCLAAGLIPCDGRTINASTSTQYQALYNVIGNIYGGTNNTDFKVPDLRTSRRYIYGQSVVSGGIYTPSLSANTTNSVTHSHSVNGMSGESLSTNATAGSHYHSCSPGGGDVRPNAGELGYVHSHSVNYNIAAFTVGQALGTTLTKADGTGTAAGAAHTHTSNSSNYASNSSDSGTGHGHDTGTAGNSSTYTEETHTHSIPSSNVTIPVSSALDIPYVNMLYFIKI